MRSARTYLYLACVVALICGGRSEGQTNCTGPAVTPSIPLNGQVCNPISGQLETVTKLIQDANGQVAFVETDQRNMFLTLTTMGASFTPVVPEGQSSVTYTITAVTANASGLVTSVELLSSADASKADWNVVTQSAIPNPPPPSLPGVVPQPVTGSGPAPIWRAAVGASGENGSDAYCLAKIFGVCIGWPGSAGGNGAPPYPNPYSLVVPSSYGGVITTADGSVGITAASIGGDGGNGGDLYALGGNAYSGGDAANGGTVSLDNRTSVTTSGANAHGVFAFSRAGKGGIAGTAYGIYGGGGTGGAAAAGGAVTLTNSGVVTTNGVGAVGLYALSTGGSAGAGGEGWGLVGYAGSSKAGGNGGSVTVYNSGQITTHGASAYGILAQSIGGTGGNGGDAGGLFSDSGQGAPGGNAGNVTVTNAAAGEITTNGRNGIGILAQSIGGNGGASGSAGGLVALGGSGAGGASPGTVRIENFGVITTTGVTAAGMQAQSIGGGGGAVGSAGGLVAIGGSASLGGSGMAVNVDNVGQVTTTGDDSRGVLAQSIGGGGGSVGSTGGLVALGNSSGAGGNGGTVTVTNKGSTNTFISTAGLRSDAVVAQSIGGGGGSLGSSGGLVTLGGSAAQGGVGAAVTLQNEGQITTTGDDSRGVVVQSIGGGGGSAGSAGGLVTLGGSSGAGGNAGTVTVTSGGGINTAIITSGLRSDAILAQSIGGGGGSVGSSGGAVTLGGSAANGGTGNTVIVGNAGQITTVGDDSRGILAQSIGGGGGVAGKSGGAVTLGGNGGSGNDAGVVTVTNEAAGSISTTGARSTGILAQSIGGGGGAGGSAGGVVALGGSGSTGGAGKQVTITQLGTITTQGSDAAGIVAQSVGGGGGNGGSAQSGGLFFGLAIGGNAASGGDGGQSNVFLGTDGESSVQPNSITTSGDRSTGVLVQSVGGGGGNGGSAIQGTVGAGLSVSVALGGSGSVGGKGGQVALEGASTISTSGQNAIGIVLQSVGGGGGNGGTTIAGSASLGDGLSVAVAVGGKGGNGGVGGEVDATLLTGGSVTTQGDQSAGIVLQSVGGGGGNGGMTVAGSAAIGAVGAGSVSVGVGGSGGKGGAAGKVDASIHNDVTTAGDNAAGLVVQAIGGGGGNSGLTVAAGASLSGVGAGGISVGVGASGGSAGAGGQVTADYSGTLLTTGSHSAGILAQSIGGGGGNSGGTISASLSAGGVGSGGVSVGVGGNGGGGGAGGAVTFTTQSGSSITTGDSSSAGILVQSIGGGGGNGGYTVSASAALAGTGSGTVSVGVGGNGGTGGAAGTVNSTVRSNVTTYGENSGAVTVQSIGGGGGNSGVTVSGGAALAGVGAGAVAVGVGGSGGTAGNGDAVTAGYQGAVHTFGDRSAGLLVQSVGGGGGNAGGTITADLSGAGTGAGGISVGVGGNGGGAGNGAAVTATIGSGSTVTTNGASSTGVLVQSIGGGGGNGGYTITASLAAAGTGSGAVSVGIGGSAGGGGNASTVSATLNADVTTAGQDSGAIAVQSIGGGGGNAGLNVSATGAFAGTGSGSVGVGIGGSGGDGGNGAAVTATVNGNVTTGFASETGAANSAGLLVQSIGGGGGNAGIQVTGAIGAAGTGSGSVAVGVGGSGGDGGNADLVNSSFTGNVATNGNNSSGVIVQSLGGGGGNGGMNISGAVGLASDGTGAIAVGVGGSGGGGGIAGEVTSHVTGQVSTNGNSSVGVLAQSLGGGGGNGGMNVSGSVTASKQGSGNLAVGVGGFGGSGGNAAIVSSFVTGNVNTQGNASSAIVAQSLGGGGGNGALNVSGSVNLSDDGGGIGVGVGGFGAGAGNGAAVNVTASGDLRTVGDDSAGLLAQSIGGGGGKGGINVTGALNFSKGSNSTGGTVSIGVGGFAGGGGAAGDVNVQFEGGISTRPIADLAKGSSSGLVAQSIGGGGGQGGMNVSGGVSLASGKSEGYGLAVGVGGFGAVGGAAGNVIVNVTGDKSINGWGADAAGILAQSIGGGGGKGGLNVTGGIASDSQIMVGVGGSGGSGGVGKDVTVTSSADVIALATNAVQPGAAGILAQSIGGGGGNGGLNVTGGLLISKPNNTLPSITVGVGGQGGAGAVSGNVLLTQTGNVYTMGDWVDGINAQSIAGGGGNGGLNVSGAINFSDSKKSGGASDLSVVAGIGGSGGQGANAGNVTVNNSGLVSTFGSNAKGIFAQSIGGGGGKGGLNISGVFAQKGQPISVDIGGSGDTGGNAGSATIVRGTAGDIAGKVTTTGSNATAIEASSVGGGGGDAGMTFNVGLSAAGGEGSSTGFSAQFLLGGSGANAGNGGAAKVSNYSDVATQGANSTGVMAQSVGGGGGNAGISMALTFELAKKNKNNGINLAIGGGAGNGGTGSTAEVVNVGSVATRGEAAYGVLAQSIGGGGGNTALTMPFTLDNGNQLDISIGRHGGTGGAGGEVRLSSTGDVSTQGAHAFGLLAQSVGNGGGTSSSTSVTFTPALSGDSKVQDPISVAIGLEGGQGGTGGSVSVNAAGTVGTTGLGSTAIFAQSVGGGGGTGGGSLTAGLTAAALGVALGGEGGQGGTGGNVTVASTATVSTAGDDSAGILAQSVGGGGGKGGYAYMGGYKVGKYSANIGIGGTGGTGMSSGIVDVSNSGGILTHGTDSYGVLAQSIGGGGGQGGLVVGITNVPGDTTATTIGVAIGGNGGTGGTSSEVKVKNAGSVQTTGGNAVGLFAQSLGGGGGNGSTVVNVIAGGAKGSNNVSVGVGGTGGTGGSSGNVYVENATTGEIVTQGANAHGIFALSIGGGGGTGSTVVTVPISKGAKTGQTKAGSAAVSIGGNGGDGGTGGNVTVLNSGAIYTHGTKAHGILAESVGGGGGQGGIAISGDIVLTTDADSQGTNFTVAVGGSGGTGNKAGNVAVTNSGTIDVSGGNSYGIYAQSVGGGGGDGGLAVGLSSTMLTNPKSKLPWLTNFSLGGFGGSGADGGAVTVNNTGNITSHGNNSYGIFAQSVGGGGGNAGLTLSSPAYMAAGFVLDAILGGGSGGAPGTVQVNQNGNITMLGQNSQAQLAQSVNGGGGDTDLFLDFSKQAVQLGEDGLPLPPEQAQPTESASIVYWLTLGYDKLKGVFTAQDTTQPSIAGAPRAAAESAPASAADVFVTNNGDFVTAGSKSIASLVQSIGGGGGNANSTTVVDSRGDVNMQVTLGATQSAGSSGGNLDILRTGSVTTLGDDSAGNIVQSIGGGGGTLIAEVQRVNSVIGTNTAGAAIASVNLGANQSTASNGGTLTLQTTGDVSTAGARSTGLLLQSIGGGGGTASLAGYESVRAALGGTNGASGDGGAINLTNTGSVFTTGTMAHGVVLQSIGGGGGALFSGIDPDHLSVTTSSANSGNGGNIVFSQQGDISVTGDNAIGILAQSLGGGGGAVDRVFMDTAGGRGTSGSLNLTMNGNVIASGANGVGIFAQSRAIDGQGDISINLAAGSLISVGPNGVGVQVSGGHRNQIINNGSIYGTDGVDTWAIVADGGTNRVDNYGTIMGQVNLGAGATGAARSVNNATIMGQVTAAGGVNQFLNHTGAHFIAGPQVLLGTPASVFQNDGSVAIGGTERAQHTDLSGSFVQTASGTTYAKLDFASGATDQLHVTGTASLAGTLDLRLTNLQFIAPGQFSKIAVLADAGITNNGIAFVKAPSVVINSQLLFTTGTTAAVDYKVDFAPAGLGANLQAVAGYINRVQAAGSSSALVPMVTKLVYEPTLTDYRRSLQQLTPDFYGELQSGVIVSNQRFVQTLLDGGSVQYVGKRSMMWLNFAYENLRHSGYGDYQAVTQIGRRGGAGFHKRLGNHWSAGLGFSWQDDSILGHDRLWTATGHTPQVGGVIMREFGQTVVAGTLSYGWNKTDSQRVGSFTAPFAGALQRRMSVFGATARVSHMLRHRTWYLKPMLEIGLTHLMAHSGIESGVGATALVFSDYAEPHAWLRPVGEIGRVFTIGEETIIRPYVKAGNRFYLNGGKTYARAGLLQAPSSVAPMAVPISIGYPFEGAVGVQFTAGSRLSFGAEYGNISGNHYNMNRYDFFLRIPFGK